MEQLVFVEPLGIGQRHPTAGEAVEQLRDLDDRREAVALVRARVQGGLGSHAGREAELLEQSGHGPLAPVDAGLAVVAEFHVEGAWS